MPAIRSTSPLGWVLGIWVFCLSLGLGASATQAATNMDAWQKQWNFVLTAALERSESAVNRAQTLHQDSQRLAKEARSANAAAPLEAAKLYDRAAIGFKRAKQQFQTTLKEYQTLQQEVPQAKGAVRDGMRQQITHIYRIQHSNMIKAEDSFNQAVANYNQAAKLFSGNAMVSKKVLQDHAQTQARDNDFQVMRFLGSTKTALIRVRDQAGFFKRPECQPDLTHQYESILEILKEARLAFRDASSNPSVAQDRLETGRSLMADASLKSHSAADFFDGCLRNKRQRGAD